jgi:hypothetical protein
VRSSCKVPAHISKGSLDIKSSIRARQRCRITPIPASVVRSFGDHYLVSEPRGAFFPKDRAEAARIAMSGVRGRSSLIFEFQYSTWLS